MKVPVEVRCIACPLAFCCIKCRRAHERKVHQLKYDCPICRQDRFLCSINNLKDAHLLHHLAKEHLPLHCVKCGRMFANMDDFSHVDKCHESESENEVTTNFINEEKEIEDRFNSLYNKLTVEDSPGQNFEAIVSFNKHSNVATITPILQKKPVDESSPESYDEDEEESPISNVMHTPYPKAPKTPSLRRSATPHIKKFLMRQLAQYDDGEDADDDVTTPAIKYETHCNGNKAPAIDEIIGVQILQPADSTGTPTRVQEDEETEPAEEVHTPTTHILKPDICATLASAVTTSTPTHPVTCQWTLFPDQGNDSPLSEIEGAAGNGSTQQSINESSKADTDSRSKSTEPKKLKSIIITGPRSRLEGQDSSEKQVTFAESVCSSECSSVNKKKVKFAEDTNFDSVKPKRVFRRPKRLLTPGPQKMNRFINPRFQALINQFEQQGMTMARTPVYKREEPTANDLTPATSEQVALPARAINFRDDSPTIEKDGIENQLALDSPANELFRSCIADSPALQSNVVNTAIAAFTNNIAGSIQTCLTTALQASDDSTEIQFKFTITKKKVSVRRIVDDGNVVNEKSSEFDRQNGSEDNIWSTISRTVKNVFWGKQDDKENKVSTTPITFSKSRTTTGAQTSATKRKVEEISDSDVSPLNHKRFKYPGRIRGRKPLNRMSRGGVSGLKTTLSAGQQNLIEVMRNNDNFNQSF